MIAHVDADAFFASVLQRKDPRLVGKPLLALGMGGGCVIAASYEAKAFGVKTGMPLKDALKLVPQALQLPADFRETGIASKQIERILGDACPVLEQMSVDEWYLNVRSLVGGVPEDLDDWAGTVRERILRRTALSVSIGVAGSKLLAKMAGEYRKPGGVTVLTGKPGAPLTIEAFLRDRPAAAIPGIGRKRAPKTDAHGWVTAWDIATAPTDKLVAICGRPGAEMQRELLGEAVEEVVSEPALPKSVSRCRSFRASANRAFLWAHVLRHAEYTVMKMRRDGLACRGLSLWLRGDFKHDYRHIGSSVSLPQPASTEAAILPYIKRCFQRLYRPGTGYTQSGLALWHLTPAGSTQYSLFQAPLTLERDEWLQQSLDALHARFGRNAITRGAAMEVKSGTMMGFDLQAYE